MTNANIITDSLEPKLYIACLAAYNNGYLHGAWIKANQSVSAIQEEISAVLQNSPVPHAEEWAIHDYDSFGNIRLEEDTDLETIVAMVEIIKEHGELGAEIIAHYGNDIDDAKNALENYCGEYDCEEDYARELFDECYGYEIPENIRYYIDYESFSRDLFISDNYSLNVKGKCHVFNNF